MREEERQQNEAVLEHHGLEKMLQSLNKSNNKLDLHKFTEFKPLLFTQRGAVKKILSSPQ